MIRKKSISCLPCTKQTWRPWAQILLQSPKRGSRVWLHIQSRKPCVPKYGMWLTCALHCNYGEIYIEMLDTYVNPNYEEVLHSESNHTFKLWHEYITFILDIFFVILQPKCINDFFLFQLPMLTSYNSQLHIRWIQHLHNAREKITPGASQFTNLAVVKGRLCLRRKPVHAKSGKEGLKSLVEWLKTKEVPVVLFAHNAKSFHSKYVIYSVQKCAAQNRIPLVFLSAVPTSRP